MGNSLHYTAAIVGIDDEPHKAGSYGYYYVQQRYGHANADRHEDELYESLALKEVSSTERQDDGKDNHFGACDEVHQVLKTGGGLGLHRDFLSFVGSNVTEIVEN